MAKRRRVLRKLIAATLIAVAFMGVEVVGGVVAGSLAILTDAAHLLTDITSFIIAIIASQLALRPASMAYTYGKPSCRLDRRHPLIPLLMLIIMTDAGLKRAEVLSALISTTVILILVGVLLSEAVRRIIGACPAR